jgi:hypothetical protein
MSAVISACGLYRYRLERHIGDGPTMLFIMVNPSTADAEKDDQTIRKCIGFATRAGYGRILVGNKFAYRATDITKLRGAVDPIGPENDAHIDALLLQADRVVVAWGQLAKLPETLRCRWKDIVRMADARGRALHAFGTNADKHPKHPQMTGYDVPLMPWTAPWFAGRATHSQHKREAQP